MDDHAATGLAHRGFEGVEVERLEAGDVDHFGLDAALRQALGGLLGLVDAGAPADQGQVAAFAKGEATVQWQAPGVVRQRLRVHPVEPGRLEEDHRIGIVDRRQEQAVGPRRRRRHQHADAGDVREHRLGRLAVVLRRADPRAHRRAQHQRAGQAAAGAIAQAAGMGYQLLHGGVDEAHELDLHHRLQALGGHADGQPGDHVLRQRRIQHPLEAEALAQAEGGAKHPAVDPDVFAQHHHRLVLGHGPVQRQVDRLQKGQAFRFAVALIHVRPLPAAARALQQLLALLLQDRRPARVDMLEQCLRRLRGERLETLHRLLHPRLALAHQRLLALLVPLAAAGEEGAQALDRLLAPGLVDLLGGTVAAGVVGRGVVAQAIADALQQGRPLALARALQGRADAFGDRQHVVAVHLFAGEAGTHRLSARVGAPHWMRRGTEIAHWLLLTTKSTGNCQAPATFSASRKSPLLVAPSPQVVTATRCSPRMRNAEATPQACRAWVAIGTQMGKSCAASGSA